MEGATLEKRHRAAALHQVQLPRSLIAVVLAWLNDLTRDCCAPRPSYAAPFDHSLQQFRVLLSVNKHFREAVAGAVRTIRLPHLSVGAIFEQVCNSASRFRNLQCLRLSSRKSEDNQKACDDSALMSFLQSCSSLRKLHFHSRLAHEFPCSIAWLLSHGNMEVLEGMSFDSFDGKLVVQDIYDECPSVEEDFKTMAALARSDSLQRFDVHCLGVDSRVVHQSDSEGDAEPPPKPLDLVCGASLGSLSLSCSGCFNLTGKALTHLDLRPAKGFSIRQIGCPALLHLAVNNCRFDDASCAMLSQCPLLTSLHVEQDSYHYTHAPAMISDVGIRHLNSLKHLEKLALVCQAAVAPCFQLPKLVHLTLTGAPLTDRKLRDMTLACPCLEELCLSHNLGYGSSLPVSKAAAVCPRIRKLQLDRCYVTLAPLVTAYCHHSIGHLDLSYCRLMCEGLEPSFPPSAEPRHQKQVRQHLAGLLGAQWGGAELVLYGAFCQEA